MINLQLHSVTVFYGQSGICKFDMWYTPTQSTIYKFFNVQRNMRIRLRIKIRNQEYVEELHSQPHLFPSLGYALIYLSAGSWHWFTGVGAGLESFDQVGSNAYVLLNQTAGVMFKE